MPYVDRTPTVTSIHLWNATESGQSKIKQPLSLFVMNKRWPEVPYSSPYGFCMSKSLEVKYHVYVFAEKERVRTSSDSCTVELDALYCICIALYSAPIAPLDYFNGTFQFKCGWSYDHTVRTCNHVF